MMESIIDGIKKAQVEAERRCIQANAVLINDAMFFSRAPMVPHGEVWMICGLKAFYCSDLPPDVLFAVCEIAPQPKERPDDVVEVVRCKNCEHFDPRYLDEDGKFWCEYSGYGRITPYDYCSSGARKKGGDSG